jgi:hypothetical protein
MGVLHREHNITSYGYNDDKIPTDSSELQVGGDMSDRPMRCGEGGEE